MKISVCLIVRNEEDNLKRALASIPRHYEIVVADTGSTDGTVEVAYSFGANVIFVSWNDDFSAARNSCASAATGDYILVMDADEELPDDTDTQIRQFVAANPDQAGCIYIINILADELNKHRMVRFYPNRSSYYFRGFVHEQIYRDDTPASFEDLPILIRHYGYEATEYLRKNKAERYIPLYRKHLADHPEDGYMLYQMGKLYYGIANWEEAERYLWMSLQRNQVERLYYPVMLVMLGYLLKDHGRSQESVRLLSPYANVYPNFPDLFFLLGLLAMDTGNLEGVRTNFQRALEIGETEKYTSVDGVGSYKAAYNLGVFYEVIGQKEQADQYYQFASQSGYEPAIQRLKN